MTLLELAVVATLAGLILAIFVPKISSFRTQMLLDSTAQELARDVIRARGEALKRNESVSVTRLDDTAYKVRTEAPRRLPAGLAFKAGSVAEVRFAPFGLVSAGVGSMTLTAGPYERKVTVRTTGHVRVE
jgi:type II secretory pathway pseudopilin PulG